MRLGVHKNEAWRNAIRAQHRRIGRDLWRLPNVTDQTILEWSESVKLPYKSLKKGYSNFAEGYIYDVEG